MTAWVAEHGVPLLLQVAATLPDTIVTKQVQTDPGWFSKFTSIASGLMTIALLVLTVFLVPAAYNFRHTHKKISKLLDQVYGDVQPVMRHAASVADNLDYITTAIRVDVQQLTRTVATANEQLLRAVRETEERVADFHALLDVVQSEAEDVFVSTASTVRGVRAGARSLLSERERARLQSDEAEVLDDEADELLAEGGDEDELADALHATDTLDDLEALDGYDRATPPDGWTDARPRIRPRDPRRG